MKTAILIDGQNLFHTLKNMRLDEKELAWDKIFASLIHQEEDELLGVYWFRPGEIDEIYLRKENVARTLFHEKYKNREQELIGRFKERNLPSNIYQEIEGIYNDNMNWLKREKEFFSRARNKYIHLAKNFKEIELCETGFLRVDPYKQQRLGEKCVDVAIAVKLVELALTDRCDKIIILSGDLDMMQAIQVAKTNYKRVEAVSFESPSFQRPTLSQKIAEIVDAVLKLKEVDLKNKFYIGSQQQSVSKDPRKQAVEDFKKQINRKVVNDKIEEALDHMESKVEKTSLDHFITDITMIKAEFQTFKVENRRGLLHSTEINQKRAVIRFRILELLDEIIKNMSR